MQEIRKAYFDNMMLKEELQFMEYFPTVPQFLEHIRRKFGIHPAISNQARTFTYQEMVSRVAQRVHFINSLNLRKQAHIAVYSENSTDAMELFLAIPAAGCVVLMLNNAMPVEALQGVKKRFDIDAIFAGNETVSRLESMGISAYDITSIDEEEAEWADAEKEMPAAIFMTGGTVDTPKGAVLSHGAIMRGAFNGCYAPGPVISQRYMCILPLSHVFGALRSLLSCLYTGSHVLACPDVKEAIMSIPIWKPTALVLVPGMVELIMNLAALKGQSFLGDLRLIVSGAAPIEPQQIALCKKFGIVICHGYGMTEGANLTSGNCYMDDIPDAVGPIYPEQEAKIVDGELWIKGDNVMLGYYNEPELNAEVFEDGWLKTGDLAKFVDYKGIPFLMITGRIKNLIILSNGENVSPEELEEIFYKKDCVKECLVQEMRVNDTPVLGIEIYPNLPDASEEEIKQILNAVTDEINQTLPTFKRISKIVIRKEPFKRSRAMKILRNQNEAYLQKGTDYGRTNSSN